MEGLQQAPDYDGVAFLIVTTPVPPMPVVIFRENVGDNHYTNSYDLLQTIIRQSRQRSDDMSKEELERIKLIKLSIYDKMWHDIKSLDTKCSSPDDPPCDWPKDVIERCYQIFQQYFRSMVQAYTLSGDTPDLRFLPLDHLTTSDHITKKTRDHFKALVSVWDALEDTSGPDIRPKSIRFSREALDFLTYPQLVGMYAHKIRLDDK